MTEYLLTTDNFNKPASLDDVNSFAVLLMRILLLQPGTDPSHPGMGVGLVPNYRFILRDNLNDLANKIKTQIQTYFPTKYSNAAEVSLEIKSSKYLRIVVTADERRYVFDSEDSDAPVQLSDTL